MIYKNHHLVICTFQQSHKWQKLMTSQRLHKYFMMTTTCVDHRMKKKQKSLYAYWLMYLWVGGNIDL